MSTAQYYIFTPCCPDVHPAFFQVSDLTPVPGVFTYLGPTIFDNSGNSLITGQCYTVTQVTTSDLAFVGGLALAPTMSEFSYLGSECGTPEECPCEIPQNPTYNVYQIISCCGDPIKTIYTIDETLDTSVINIFTGFTKGISEGCYTITEVSYIGVGVPPYIFVTASEFTPQIGVTECTEDCLEYCPPCTCVQVEWTGTTVIGEFFTLRYKDCDLNFQQVDIEKINGNLTEKFCYTSWVSPLSEDWTPMYYGACVDDGAGEKTCFSCYRLEDCKGIKEDIYSLNPLLGTYALNNQVITIAEEEGCWKVFTSLENCECAITTTIVESFIDCTDCDPIKGYKLTECTTGEVIYTTTDLSGYTLAYITTDCPGCWEVEPLNIVPPTDQPVVVDASYGTCESCNASYYLLTPCAPDDALDPIVTTTDLSDQVGSVITLNTCPDICWTVSETTYSENTQVVSISGIYDECIDCIKVVKPCICSTATNGKGISSLNYIDCDGIEQSIIVDDGATTDKICLLYWLPGKQVGETSYGNCVDGECPVPPQPKRKVTPGYNTPVCSTDYYEKVECRFSEGMYKDVLSERYGISNCCPDDDMKWIIKHEMLMLDILVNPDYTCTPITSCQCPVIGGTTLNTTCPDVTKYILTPCSQAGNEIVQIENTYNVLGNVIIINDICYTVLEPTNQLVTAYWTPGEIYTDCQECLSQ